jgi:hypothetical protein
MQYAHTKQLEAISEQIKAMRIKEDDFTETYIECLDPLELELDNEKNEEVHGEIPDESMDDSHLF